MRLSTLFLVLLAPLAASAQTDPKQLDFNNNLWVSYSGDHPVSGPWGVHFDVQWRRSDLGTIWQQYQVRPGLNYKVSEKLLLTLGYVYTRSYPYGDNPAPRAFPEHRTYQQALVRHALESVKFQHRFRFEERFIQPSTGPSKWRYQNRFRYMFKIEVPLTRKSNGDAAWYIPAFDEIVIGVPPNYGPRPFDQNRVFVGIGRSLEDVKVEVGYLTQFLGQRNGRVFEFNNTIVVAVSSDFDLSNLWR